MLLSHSHSELFSVFVPTLPSPLSVQTPYMSVPFPDNGMFPSDSFSSDIFFFWQGPEGEVLLGEGDSEGLCLGAGLLFLVLPYLPASNLGCYVGFVMAERVLYMPR